MTIRNKIIIVFALAIIFSTIYMLTDYYNSKKVIPKQREEITTLYEKSAKDNPAAVIKTFMWAAANNDVGLIKKTTLDINLSSESMAGIYFWTPTEIKETSQNNVPEFYNYKTYNVNFDSKTTISTNILSGILFNRQPLLKKVITMNHAGFVLVKEKADSVWKIKSFGFN